VTEDEVITLAFQLIPTVLQVVAIDTAAFDVCRFAVTNMLDLFDCCAFVGAERSRLDFADLSFGFFVLVSHPLV
jgi:hypothetical protein